MGYKPAKWPTYANDALEDALSLIEDTQRELARLQAATAKGEKIETVLAITDSRLNLMKAHSTLIQGKTGVYRRLDGN